MYTLTAYENTIYRSDGAWIPTDPDNRDYQAYLKWLEEGNTPEPYVPPPSSIPEQVPMWAVRTILQEQGLFDQAQALVTASTNNALKNIWEYGNFATRSSPTIIALAGQLGLTSEQLDQMFTAANALEV